MEFTNDTQKAYPKAEDYKKLDQRTHVYVKADTYIGSDEKVERQEWVYDLENNCMEWKTIDFVPGCERLFMEVLSNASDNVGRSRRAGIDPGVIDVSVDEQYVSITNYGLPIPIEIHPVEKMYVPQMIFGSLLTSSNYEVEERSEAGTNGIGAKAANIFSKEFTILIKDHIRKLSYSQRWEDNMQVVGEPKISPFSEKTSSVSVVYKMDFERFGYPDKVYTPDAIALFARHCVDVSFTAKTTVTFNNSKFALADIREYARLYFGDAVDNAIVHYQWPKGTEVLTKKKGYQVAKDKSISPDVEMILMDTPDEGHQVSFVNCIMTKDGGVHVDAAIKASSDGVIKTINEASVKKLTRSNKGKELDAKQKRSHTITIGDVKPHVSILVSVRVKNPKFPSQTKTSLESPVPKITISEETLRGINKWSLISRLDATIQAKQFASTSKKDGKLKGYLKLPKGVDANNAGKYNRADCVLYITEGKSGAGYANTLLGLIPGGRDNIGVLPMRGKLYNVMDKTTFQIDKNNEISELKAMLGLVDGTHYIDPANFSRLRYGGVMIMADSDVDGKHIIGLILNFFHCRFPSLLARGYVLYYRTPTLRVSLGKTSNKFYTQREYEVWRDSTKNYKTWKHKYYKGLGTSKDSEIKEDFETPRVVTCFYDEHAPEAMRLAFDKGYANKRKEWMSKWKPGINVENVEMQPISSFINEELVLFSIANTQRSIPKLVDGFKESHRKIIYGAHSKWKVGSKKEYNEVKVAQLTAFIAEKSNYHHGEAILDDVVVGMAQDFTGSNNIPWFSRDGQFGCVAPDTKVLVWGGYVKRAKDIHIDDLLVGDDGKKRRISKIVNGVDQMFSIHQEDGETYTVNSKHILTLRYTSQGKVWSRNKKWYVSGFCPENNEIFNREHVSKDKAYEEGKSLSCNDVFDIRLSTYLSFPDKEQFEGVCNHVAIDWKLGSPVEDAYLYGKSLSDGTRFISTPMVLSGIQPRLKILAGIIDGEYEKGKACITSNDVRIFSGREATKEFIAVGFLSKSLGFKVQTKNGLLLSGDFSMIPSAHTVGITRTIPSCGKIRIESVDVGMYYGWYIDGNERFLLGDFTCTHNTRFEGGKDAAETRYSHTKPEKIMSKILRKEDRPLLTHIVDEGDEVEPETYYPVIPMVLVNGAQGIGTGYSTFIPNHNPEDIIRWLKLRLEGVSQKYLPEVLPWYRDFHGEIHIIDRRKLRNGKLGIDAVVESGTEQSEKETSSDSVEDFGLASFGYSDRPLLSMVSLGIYHVNMEGVVVVTELPIGSWPQTYHKWLEELVEEKKITGFRDLSVNNAVYFEIYGMKKPINHRVLRLRGADGMSNMVLLNERNVPTRYNTATEILEAFYEIRLPLYTKRKGLILEQLEKDITSLNHRVRFVRAVIDGEVIIINRKKTEIYTALDKLEIPREIYDSSMSRHLSEDDVLLLQQQSKDKSDQLEAMKNTPPESFWLTELEELEKEYSTSFTPKKSGVAMVNIPKLTSKFPGSTTTKSPPKRKPKTTKGKPADLSSPPTPPRKIRFIMEETE